MLTDNPAAPLILIVEDDDDHAVLIRRSFQAASEHYRMATVIDLHNTRKFLSEHTPDLILVDYCLPDGKGCDLLKMAAGVYPVVIMTSQGSEQLEAKVKEAGALDYVVKSWEGIAAMPEIVNSAMGRWEGTLGRKQT